MNDLDSCEDIEAPARRSAAEIETWLRAALARRLAVAPASVDAEAPFTSFGLDSVQAVELAAALESWSGIAVPATAAWDHPSIRALARSLASAARRPGPEAGAPPAAAEPIAVIGLGCRFPGAAGTAAFWELLSTGRSAISAPPPGRWIAPEVPQWGGFLADLDRFDADFFEIARREAPGMDPQQRLLLEVAWEALEDAAVPPRKLAGTAAGVFVGISASDYVSVTLRADRIDAWSGTGNAHSIAANRLSYLLDLRGPSLALDTACSSSLVAIHLACRSLRSGETSLALAGGVNVLVAPHTTRAFHQAHMLAPDGRCKTFSADADGYVRSEGCGVVVLKRLSEAIADGDRIAAVIHGSAVNQDGRTNGLTAPSREAQQAVIEAALRDAGRAAEELSYVEAHGTGTPLGDPIEVAALRGVLGPRSAERPCALGSVKTNLGHLETAAGVAGLAKVVLALQHRMIPPHLNLRLLNPEIDLGGRAVLSIPTALTPWVPTGGTRLLAGVNSFGFGGTNAHLIVGEPPAATARLPRPPTAAGGAARPHLLVLSARREAALLRQVENHAAFLEAHPLLPPADVCLTAGAGRNHFARRLAVTGASAGELAAELRRAAHERGRAERRPRSGKPRRERPRLAFLFSGQGHSLQEAGRRLSVEEPVFRAALERCDALLAAELGESLLALLHPAEPAGETARAAGRRLADTRLAQPALFAVQMALVALWRSWGVVPDVVLGHSAGALAAACAAGAVGLEAALRLAAGRGRLLGSLPAGGAMLAVRASEEQAGSVLRASALDLDLAAVNGPRDLVLAGPRAAVDEAAARLTAAGFASARLDVSHAFHSRLVEPALDGLEALFGTAGFGEPSIPVLLDLNGAAGGGVLGSPRFWREHARRTVRFADALRAAAALGVDAYVEIGPGSDLLASGRRCLGGEAALWLPSLGRQDGSDRQRLLGGLAALYRAGAELDWDALSGPEARRTALPTYPFERQRYWIDPPAEVRPEGAATTTTAGSPPAGSELRLEAEIRLDLRPDLADHRIYGQVVLPAAFHVAAGLAAASRYFGDEAVALTDLAVARPLWLPAGEPLPLATTLVPAAGGGALLTISSRDPGNLGEESAYARGKVARLQWPGPAPASPAFSLGAARRGPEAEPGEHAELQAKSADELYAFLEQAGIEVGPNWRWIERLWCGGGEARGRLRPPAGAPGEPAAGLSAGLIDGLFHLAGALLPGPEAGACAYLPHLVESVTLRGRPGSPLWGRAALRPAHSGNGGGPRGTTEHGGERGDLVGDFQLLDDAGDLVAEIAGVWFRRVERDALLSGAAAATGDCLYELTWRDASSPPSAAAANDPPPAAGTWLVFHHPDAAAGPAGLGAELAGVLAREGGLPVTLVPGTANRPLAGDRLEICLSDLEGAARLLAGAAPRPWRGLVYLSAAAAEGPAPLAGEVPAAAHAGCAEVLYLLRALFAGGQPPRRLWVVTRGAQAAAEEGPASGEAAREALAEAPLWGLGRVVALEYPELGCALVDLDPAGGGDGEAEGLLAEVLGGDGESQVALRGGRRRVARLARYLDRSEPPAEPAAAGGRTGSVRLDISARGLLDNLTLVPAARIPPAAGEVEIEVRAAALNFRDVLNALDLYPGDPGPLGGEAAGVVSALGPGSAGLADGDEVIGLFAPGGCMRSFALCPASLVVPKPRDLSFEAAAGLPVAYLTALYGLRELAGLAAGERVLIHAAAGGVGLAAVHVARRAGAEVFATAGSAEKRQFLTRLGVEHVFDSRTPAFAAEVRRRCGGAGLDVVLNSLTGEMIPASMALVRPGGRFVELGKTDVWDAARIAERGWDLRYHSFDLVEVSRRDPGLVRSLLVELAGDVAAGALPPLPHRTFPLRERVAAFRHMAQARHIGKVVLDMTAGEPALPPASAPARTAAPATRVRADATYLVTGGLGALGLHAARWLAAQGARHVVLAGRRGTAAAAPPAGGNGGGRAGDAAPAVAELAAGGVAVEVIQLDVADRRQVAAQIDRLRRASPPLLGIVHAAGVLDDGMLLEQDGTRLAAVLAPKVDGAWNLHRACAGLDLDFFVLYSSAASLLGSPGQATYAAANAFLDALAHHRQAQGLAASAINWGPWSGAGMAAASPGPWQALGIRRLSPAQGSEALSRLLLTASPAQVAVMPVRWAALAGRLSGQPVPALLRDLLGGEAAAHATGADGWTSDLPRRLAAGTPEERRALIARLVIERTAVALGRDPESLDEHTPLAELGLDSLMVTELRNAVSAVLARDLPLRLFAGSPTIAALVAELAGAEEPFDAALGAADAPPAPTAAGPVLPGLERFLLKAAATLRRIEETKAAGLSFFERPVSRLDGQWVECADGQRQLMFATYNYLGLLGHPRIAAAAAAAAAQYGTGTHGVRLLGGTLDLHHRLERRLADFHGREAAITFSSGFLTNQTVLSTLVGRGDWVISDQLNHASIVEGCAGSGAVFRVFRHNDMEALEDILRSAPDSGVVLVVADAVFSLDGDIFDLPRASELCRRYGALLMVDEAHSLGVLGAGGRGIEEHFGLTGAIDVCMGTLSKAIPAVGGYVAGDRRLVDVLRVSARGYVFSAAMPPPVAAAALAAFDVLAEEVGERRAALERNSAYLIRQLRANGFDTGKTCSPVVPVIVGSDERALLLTRHCQERGLFALPALPPAVPEGTARLRLNVTAVHTLEDIHYAIEVLVAAAAVIPGIARPLPLEREKELVNDPPDRPAVH